MSANHNVPSLTPTEVLEALRRFLRLGPADWPTPVLLGPPGVGKTQIVAQFAKTAGLPLFTTRLSQHDVLDGLGYPHIEKGACRADWVPFSSFAPPADFRGVWFLDELTQCDAALQRLAASLLDRQGVAGRRLSPNTIVIGAGNRRGDRAGATDLLAHLARRCWLCEVTFDVGSWLAWAEETRVHPVVVAYARAFPGEFVAWDAESTISATPASWERLSRALSAGALDLTDEVSAMPLIAGYIGRGAAQHFFSFAANAEAFAAQARAVLAGEMPVANCEPLTNVSVAHALTASLLQQVRALARPIPAEVLDRAIQYIRRCLNGHVAVQAVAIHNLAAIDARAADAPALVTWLEHQPGFALALANVKDRR